MLYTTEQISKMFSGIENNVSTQMITKTWIPNGLKHMKGKKNGFLFKKEWVDEYIENQAMQYVITSKVQKQKVKRYAKKGYAEIV